MCRPRDWQLSRAECACADRQDWDDADSDLHLQGFFLVPYRIFAPTLFPIFTVLRYCRILPYPM